MTERTTPPAAYGGRLEELDEDTCRSLLALKEVGRLVWNGDEGLSVITANYAPDGSDVLLRLAPWSRAAQECDRAAVAFQVDDLDATLRHGWSVLARGWARVDLMPATRPGTRVDVWPEGIRPVTLRVETTRLTGRRLDGPA